MPCTHITIRHTPRCATPRARNTVLRDIFFVVQTHPRCRQAALGALCAFGDAAVPYAPDVASLLEDTDVDVRCAALQAAGSMRVTSLLPGVERCLSDTSPEVVSNACLALGTWERGAVVGQRLVEEQIIQTIAEQLESGRTRQAAASALASLGEEAVAAHAKMIALVCLPDPDFDVRQQGLTALSTLTVARADDQELLDVVVSLLQHEEVRVRCAAALALAHCGENAKHFLSELRPLLDDEAEDTSWLTLSLGGVRPKVPSQFRKTRCAACFALGQIGEVETGRLSV